MPTLESNKTVSVNWELEIKHSTGSWGGTFSLSQFYYLILAYNQEDDYNRHAKAKIARIDNGKIIEIYETKSYLCTPTIDKNQDLYVCTYGAYNSTLKRSDRNRLFKIDPDGVVIWEYLLDTGVTTKPVMYQDSIVVYNYDYMESSKCGVLYRFNENGSIVWKKLLNGNALTQPLILTFEGQDYLGLNLFDRMLVLDMNGNIFRDKKIGHPVGHGSYIDGNKGFYACINPNLIYLNLDLDIIWVYKPECGFVSHPPSLDSHGNLYCMLTGKRMVSLDSKGKERWIVETGGDIGYYPIVLANGDILVVTEGNSEKKASQIQSNTYLEIFSIDGTKLMKNELPGYVLKAMQCANGTIFIATGCKRIFSHKHQFRNSIKVFSISIT